MLNRIESTTPKTAQWFKEEIEKTYRDIKTFARLIKEAKDKYFIAMHAHARTAIEVYLGNVDKKEFKKEYEQLVENYKSLWALVVRYEECQMHLSELKEERRQFYEQLGKQSD